MDVTWLVEVRFRGSTALAQEDFVMRVEGFWPCGGGMVWNGIGGLN